MNADTSYNRPKFLTLFLLLLTLLGQWGFDTPTAQAATPIDAGYRDYKFNSGCNSTPTGEKPESKLWFNDGFWWGSLCDDATATYHIHRFNWVTQDWEDTNVLLDSRGGSKADVLWDGVSQKLYVVSHLWSEVGAATASTSQWGKLFRYGYDAVTKTYSLDAGFPVNVTRGTGEALTVAKDSTGKLWVTYVEGSKVMVNHSATDDLTWGTPYALPVTGASALDKDDIAAVVSHAGKIAIMWSNQKTKIMYLAFHDDSEANDQTWSSISVYNPGGSAADDHMNLKSLQTDGGERLFAVTKTSYSTPSSQPLIVLLACTASPCTTATNWQAHMVYTVGQANTRPILLIDPEHQKLHIFSTDTGSGNGIHHKVSDISNIQFASATDEPFIKLASDAKINNVTSTKQHVNSGTGILVAASSQTTFYYYHNCIALSGVAGGCNTSALPVTVAFASVAYNANENAGTATITVNLSRGASNPITVNYATSDGTATAGSDYTAASGTLTFTPGTISQSFTVPIANDTFGEANETVNVTLSAANGADLTAPTSAVLTISDDDPFPAVQFAQASQSVDEDEASGKATVNVQLSAGVPTTVTVAYAASNGTATSGSDYAPASGVVIFSPGQTSKSFDLPILDDELNETDETIQLALSAPSGATLGALTTAVVTIIDEDLAPVVQFAAPNINSSENSATALLSVTLSAPSGQQVTVSYATSNGSATAGTDYSAANGTLTFAPGETNKTITVALLDDNLDEPNETVNATLANPTNAALGAPNPATLTLLDDDGPATVRFNAAQAAVSESNAQANVTVNLVGTTATTVTVNYATADGTAVAGNDYTPQSGILRFAPGASSATFAIPIKNDSIDEDEESIRLLLSNVSNNAVLGDPATEILLITDNDNPPLVQFAKANFDTPENVANGRATITVQLNLASGRPVSVTYTTDAGTATKGSDFTAVSDVVVIPAGQTSATFFVPLANDNNDEPDETVSLALLNATNAILGATSNSTLTILDDDLPGDTLRVEWSSATYQVNEGAGVATLTAQLNAAPVSALTVAYVVNAGTATAGEDYSPPTGSFTFAPGETSKIVAITVVDDPINEASETFTVTLQASAVTALGLNANALVTMQDNDPQPSLQINGNQLWVDPGVTEAKLTLRLSSPSGQVISIDYTVKNGAVSGSSPAPSGTILFTPGEVSKTIAFPFSGNNDGTELILSNPQNVQLGEVETILVVIANGRAYLPVMIAP